MKASETFETSELKQWRKSAAQKKTRSELAHQGAEGSANEETRLQALLSVLNQQVVLSVRLLCRGDLHELNLRVGEAEGSTSEWCSASAMPW